MLGSTVLSEAAGVGMSREESGEELAVILDRDCVKNGIAN